MDINVILARKGIRVARRHIEQHKLPDKQHVTLGDAVHFLNEKYHVEVY